MVAKGWLRWVIIIGLIGGVGIVIARARASNQSVRYVTAAATKGTLTSSVSATGNVIVDHSAKVTPTVTGTVGNLQVAVGDEVKKGQKLFEVSNDQIDVTVNKAYTAYLQAKQAVTTAQIQLTNAQTTLLNQSQDSGQAKAQASLDQANQQLAQAQLQLTEDQATLAKNQQDNKTTPGTHSDSDIQIIQAKIASDQATITADQSTIAAASVTLEQSKNTATGAVQVAQQQVTAAQQAVEIAQKNVQTTQADYTNQQTTAGGRIVTAPIDGTITTLSVSNGDQIGTSNSAASTSSSTASSPVVIEDLSSLKVSIQLNEVDAAKVKPDQKVSMTFDAIDGLTLTGKIEKVETTGTVSQGVVSYATVVDFDSLDKRVLPEMSVSVTVTTDVKQDVVTVPNAAVKAQSDGSHYVQLLENGTPKNQSVDIGLANDSETEITNGLTEGTEVITQTITNQKQSSTTNSTGLGIPGLGGGGANFRRTSGGGAAINSRVGD